VPSRGKCRETLKRETERPKLVKLVTFNHFVFLLLFQLLLLRSDEVAKKKKKKKDDPAVDKQTGELAVIYK